MRSFSIVAAFCIGLLIAGNRAWAGPCGDGATVLHRLEMESILDDVAMTHSLDPDLLSAIARVESGECSDAVSPKGAVGLMQLMPATASTYGVEDRFDPVQNALGAARFIDYLKRDRPEGKLTLPEILAAYNAGEAAVTRARGIPHFRETEDYVRRVLWLYLIGHVPQSERAREAVEKPMPTTRAAKVKTSPRFAAGSDGEIFGQLAEVRRERRQSEAGSGAAAQ